MKKSIVILLTIVALLAIVGVWVARNYNTLVTANEAVETAWAKVESQYQRRADLIPNLVNTVKGYAAHEQETLDAVVSARARATQTTIDPSQLTSENIKAYQAAQGEVGAVLGRLLMVTENYPDLKANQNFRDLQSQLEGTENRITVARDAFNTTVQAFNTMVRRFPRNIIASMFGFEKVDYFQAEEQVAQAPSVEL